MKSIMELLSKRHKCSSPYDDLDYGNKLVLDRKLWECIKSKKQSLEPLFPAKLPVRH